MLLLLWHFFLLAFYNMMFVFYTCAWYLVISFESSAIILFSLTFQQSSKKKAFPGVISMYWIGPSNMAADWLHFWKTVARSSPYFDVSHHNIWNQMRDLHLDYPHKASMLTVALKSANRISQNNDINQSNSSKLTFFTSLSFPARRAVTRPCHVIASRTIRTVASFCTIQAVSSLTASCRVEKRECNLDTEWNITTIHM